MSDNQPGLPVATLAEIRATAFHEAGHAVAALALGHVVEWIRLEPPGGRNPGLTKRTVSGPGDPNLLNEECAIVELIGGVVEARHSSTWTPTPWSRDGDLAEVKDRLRNTGSSDRQIAAFMERAEKIASELATCDHYWKGVAALAEHLESGALKHPDIPVRFHGTTITKVVIEAVAIDGLSRWAELVRGHAPELNALRTS